MSLHLFRLDEQERLGALRAYSILDTGPEPGFDELTRLASQICRTPIALISFIDSNRQWFKARVGMDVTETPLCDSICLHAIRGPDLFVVPDTRKDERFARFRTVTADPRIRFYAGMPLIDPNGYALGTLCVMDTVLRQLRPDQADALRLLARQVMNQIRLSYGPQGIADQSHSDSVIDLEYRNLKQTIKSMQRAIGVAAHELRNPLAGIRAMTQFLKEPQAMQMPESAGVLASLGNEVDRMFDIVDTLLESARLDSGRARWNWSFFDLDPICRDVLENTRLQLGGKPIELSSELDAFGQFMRGDVGAIRRLLLNMVGNARKYTQAGKIWISVTGSFVEGKRWVELKVSDTGQGIPTNMIDGLGEAFALNTGVVGENELSGTGLGLSICKAIASAHGGEMSIHSGLGKGTIVSAKLRADLEGPAFAAMDSPSLNFTTTGLAA
jgi:signal transduction histidine kinase